MDLVDLVIIFGEEWGLCGLVEDWDYWWFIVECFVLVIVVIDGLVVGMGVEFVIQCDICFVFFNVWFVWNFV